MAKKEKKEQHLPFNQEAEKALLGSVLASPDIIPSVSVIAGPDDFSDPDMAETYRAALAIYDSGGEIGLKALAGTVEEEKVRGYFKLAEETSPELAESKASGVHAAKLQRRLYYHLKDLASRASGGEEDPEALGHEAKAFIDEFTATCSNNRLRITAIDIIDSNPRSYRIRFNRGGPVSVSLETLFEGKVLKRAIVNARDEMPSLPTGQSFMEHIERLLAVAIHLPAPVDADIRYELLETLRNLFAMKGEAESIADLAEGAYAREVLEGTQYILFQRNPALSYIKSVHNSKMNSSGLWQTLQGLGAISHHNGADLSVNLNRETRHRLWAIPAGIMDMEDQQENIELRMGLGLSEETVDKTVDTEKVDKTVDTEDVSFLD